MSSEIIEAVFRYSHYYRKDLMLVASKNQIDWDGGYVNGWTTEDYMKYVNQLSKQYYNAKVYICRDHCGPGFNGDYDLEDTYKTIEQDIGNGFDLIHVDFCNCQGNKEKRLEESKKAVEYCIKLNPNINLEVGTDENEGLSYSLPNIKEIENEIGFFKKFCNPKFYVVQTGSLVKEINQVGSFNKFFIENILKILRSNGMKLKEHNADYLSKKEIFLRKGLVDAMNIAPQLGVVQTQFVLNRCLVYGIDFSDFIEEVYRGGRWRKWMYKNSADNKFLCSIIAGHYHFASSQFKQIMEQLEEREEIHENIINVIMELINHYEQ